MSSFPEVLLLILAGILGTASSLVVTLPPQVCPNAVVQLRQAIMVTVGPDFDICLKASSSCTKKDGCCIPSILKSNCDSYVESLCSGETCGCCLMKKTSDSSEEKSNESGSSEKSSSGSGSNESGSGSKESGSGSDERRELDIKRARSDSEESGSSEESNSVESGSSEESNSVESGSSEEIGITQAITAAATQAITTGAQSQRYLKRERSDSEESGSSEESNSNSDESGSSEENGAAQATTAVATQAITTGTQSQRYLKRARSDSEESGSSEESNSNSDESGSSEENGAAQATTAAATQAITTGTQSQ